MTRKIVIVGIAAAVAGVIYYLINQNRQLRKAQGVNSPPVIVNKSSWYIDKGSGHFAHWAGVNQPGKYI